MARVIALVHGPQSRLLAEMLRIGVVAGCALALIAAERALPVIPF